MTQEAPATPAPKKSRKTLLMAIAAVVILGGGGAAYWTFRAQAAEAPEAPAAVEETAAIVHFDPFVVNLSDPGGRRYLRLSLELVVSGEEHAKEFAENTVMRMRVRSSILEMLAQQTADQLTTVEGKAALKTAVIERASEKAEALKITDVLFSEFIVQ
jgi:flagellar FliL protein